MKRKLLILVKSDDNVIIRKEKLIDGVSMKVWNTADLVVITSDEVVSNDEIYVAKPCGKHGYDTSIVFLRKGAGHE